MTAKRRRHQVLELSPYDVDTLLMALEFAIEKQAPLLKEYESVEPEVLVSKLENFCIDNEQSNTLGAYRLVCSRDDMVEVIASGVLD
jgi:hypothetical protein